MKDGSFSGDASIEIGSSKATLETQFNGWDFKIVHCEISWKWYTFLRAEIIKHPWTTLDVFFYFEFNLVHFFKKFIYFNWRLITLRYCIGFAIPQHDIQMPGSLSLWTKPKLALDPTSKSGITPCN